MAHYWEDFDEFTDNSPPPGDKYLHGEYIRWLAWSGSKNLAFAFGTHSVTCGIGTLTNAYASLPRGYAGPFTFQRSLPTGAAAWTSQSAEVGTMLCVLSRRHWVANGSVKATFQVWEHLSPWSGSSVRFAGVACRVQGQSFSEADATSGTSYRHAYSQLGSGYIFGFFNNGTTSGLALLKVVDPSSVTVLASSATVANYFGDATLMSMTATNSGGSVRLRCTVQYDPTVQSILAANEQEVVVFDYVDSSPGGLAAPGRCGVLGSSTPAAGVSVLTMVRSFRIDDDDYGGTVHNDEWQRADPAMCWLFDSSTGLDSNQLAGRCLHSRYAHDATGAMYLTTTADVDVQPARCRVAGDLATVPVYYDTTGWDVSGSYNSVARYFDNYKLADPDTTDRTLKCTVPNQAGTGFFLFWRARFRLVEPSAVGELDTYGYNIFVRRVNNSLIQLSMRLMKLSGSPVSLCQSLPFAFGKYNFLYGTESAYRVVASTVTHPTYGTSMQVNLYINGIRFEDWTIQNTATVKSEPAGLIIHGTSYQAGLDFEGFAIQGSSNAGVASGVTATLWGRQTQTVTPTVAAYQEAAAQVASCGAATGQTAGCTAQAHQVS